MNEKKEGRIKTEWYETQKRKKIGWIGIENWKTKQNIKENNRIEGGKEKKEK